MLTKTEKERLAALLRKKAEVKRRVAKKKAPTKRKGVKLPTPAEVARAYGVKLSPSKTKVTSTGTVSDKDYVVLESLDGKTWKPVAEFFGPTRAKDLAKLIGDSGNFAKVVKK